MLKILQRSLGFVLLFIAAALLVAFPARAEPTSSDNFQIREDYIGPGGGSGSSENFQVQDSVGDIGVGRSESPEFAADSGSTTTDDPALGFEVDTSNVNLGALSTTLTKTGTATFSVLNYTSYGYVVQIVGDPPMSGSSDIDGMDSPAASSVGTEQFGINLVANTSPAAFGANPVQAPDSTFSFGEAATGYNTPNMFKYVPGDVIATAPKSSGKTTYTISYIANISNNTAGGSYSVSQSLVVTGTY